MINSTSRKSLAVFLNRIYFYPLYPAPEPMPRTRRFWIASGLVAVAALLFSAFFIYYTAALHTAYLTHAEDLGIYDQAIWSMTHGQLFHQTICNNISDTNCYSLAGIPRFAIHFEPILFLVTLFYFVVPNPKTLMALQALVVASGAFPAFWLARLRLRNEWAGVAIAILYLLYPAQLEATNWEFHAVTFTAALLLFAVYFMYTRHVVWMFVFAILAMACKEEIAGIVALLGLWSIVFQRRWRSGLLLIVLAFAWTGTALLVYHTFSPTGQSLLTSRYSYLGKGLLNIARNLLLHPRNTLKLFVLERDHALYLRGLLIPAGFLPLLAPWILVLAFPTIVLNLLSNNPQMYSGMYQYNAEIVPILIFATIEGIVLILWLLRLIVVRLRAHESVVVVRASTVTSSLTPASAETRQTVVPRVEAVGSDVSRPLNETRSSIPDSIDRPPAPRTVLSPVSPWSFVRIAHVGLLTLLLCYILVNTVRVDYLRENMPFSHGFQWPQASAHTALAQHFIDMIPSNASVSAQATLVPHLSHRTSIYQFPYADERVDYIFLDVTSDTIYPFYGSADYIREVKRLLLSGNYGVLAAQDGYLLLKRGLPPPGVSPYSIAQPGSDIDRRFLLPQLPDSFCSFAQASPEEVDNAVQVTFLDKDTSAPVADLIGYAVDAPKPFSVSGDLMGVTTYWRVAAPSKVPLQPIVFMTDQHGQEYLASFDFSGMYWCQTNAWKPGTIVKLQSRLFGLEQYFAMPRGLVHVSIALIPLTQVFDTMMGVQHRLPLHVVKSSDKVAATNSSNGLLLMPIRLVA